MWTSGRIDEHDIIFWKAPYDSCLGPKRMVFVCPRARAYGVQRIKFNWLHCQFSPFFQYFFFSTLRNSLWSSDYWLCYSLSLTEEGLVRKNGLLEEVHEGLQICANWCHIYGIWSWKVTDSFIIPTRLYKIMFQVSIRHDVYDGKRIKFNWLQTQFSPFFRYSFAVVFSTAEEFDHVITDCVLLWICRFESFDNFDNFSI